MNRHILTLSVFFFVIAGCASSDEDVMRKEQAIKDRVAEQQKRAREADYELKKSVE